MTIGGNGRAARLLDKRVEIAPPSFMKRAVMAQSRFCRIKNYATFCAVQDRGAAREKVFAKTIYADNCWNTKTASNDRSVRCPPARVSGKAKDVLHIELCQHTWR